MQNHDHKKLATATAYGGNGAAEAKGPRRRHGNDFTSRFLAVFRPLTIEKTTRVKHLAKDLVLMPKVRTLQALLSILALENKPRTR
jgi:hypothetical protein